MQKKRNSQVTAASSSATNKASNEIAELREKNEKLEKHLEEVKSEAYLEKMTSDALEILMRQSNIKGKNLSEFVKSFTYYLGLSAIATPVGAGLVGTGGAIIGAIIGASVGTIIPGAGTVVGATGGAQVGATIGGTLGAVSTFGASVKDAYDDCNQQ